MISSSRTRRLALTALLPLAVSGAVLAQGYNPYTPPAPLPPGASTPPPGAAPQAQSQNPVCARLENQLGLIDRGYVDPGRAAQIRSYEDSVNKQQANLDRLVAQQRRLGCQSSGFFSIFSNQPPQCTGLNAQIDQARTGVDRAMVELQRLQSTGGSEQVSQRQSVLTALAQNNCGPQYRAAAAPQRGFFEGLFGGGSTMFGGNPMFGGVDVSQGGTFRTICVRTCDGYYYPISFATTPARFGEDENTCRATCPNAEVQLYSHRTNEDVRQAVSLSGHPYTELPNAFRYRQQYDAACSCRKAGQSWADALGATRDLTVERGDIIVTDEKAKALSQPKIDPRAARTPQAAPAASTTATPQSAASNVEHRSIRTIGPAPYPVRQ